MDVDGDGPQDIQSNGAALAPQACQNCRKQKRKCDKQMPSCSLCNRIGRICDYSVDHQSSAPSSEEFAALRQKVADLEGLLTRSAGNNFGPTSNGSSGGVNLGNTGPWSNNVGSNGSGSWSNGMSNGSSPANLLSLTPPSNQPMWPGPSTFPSLFFLDSEAFDYERYQIQPPYVKVPPGALSALGNSTELRQMIEQYFETVQTYFPMVSKIRLYQHLSNPMHEPGADMALLFLSMKLITSEVPEGMPSQTQLYQDVKSFLNHIEAQNGYSIQLIQSLLLVSLYELGHAIYPAAYMSIGNAARLGHVLGIHDRTAPQMLPRPMTWTEQEERRRVWWAVIILDRFISIGHRRKPFASTDPSLDAHLPTDDSHWDRGQMLVAAPLALSASQAIRAAPFARTCQAAHLLGKIIRHINDKNIPADYKFNEALQLHRTMRALAEVLPSEAEADDPTTKPTLCSPMAICYSGLLTLYDQYACTERAVENGPETQLVMQKESIDGLGEVSSQVIDLARRVRGFIERAGLQRVSPLVVDSLYQSAANCKSHTINRHIDTNQPRRRLVRPRVL